MNTITLAEVSVNGRGYYGIGASAVPYSNDLYTYLRITDIMTTELLIWLI